MHPSEWPSLPATHATSQKVPMDGTELHKCGAGRPGQVRGDRARARAARAGWAMPMAWGIAWRKNTCRDALVVVYAPSERRL